MLAFLDSTQILPYALFGLFAGAGWLVYELLAARESRTEERLEELNSFHARRRSTLDRGGKKETGVARVLEKASPMLARVLQPKTDAEVGKLRAKLIQAGFRGETAPQIFLSLKFAGLVAGFVLGGGASIVAQGLGTAAIQYTLLATGVGFYLPDIVLAVIARKRKEQIFLGLPDALDLMVVCVEAGLGLDQAMRKVTEELGKSYPVIADEFGLSNFQLQVGRSRIEVLRELGNRSGVEDLRTLASVLIQADKLGASVGQALRVQSDGMRIRRRQIAEEKAAKTAVKLIFPLVLFIFPGIFVVLVGPAAVKFVREMAPAMAGE